MTLRALAPLALTPLPAMQSVHAQAAALADTVRLDLRHTQVLALTQSPALLAARQDTAIARGDRRQARTYRFNPELGVLLPGVPGGAGGLYEVSLTQEIEWAGQQGARTAAADLGVVRAAAAVGDVARVVVGTASIAYYRAVAVQSRLRLAEQALTLSERLITAVRTQVREGEISVLEANLAEIEAGRARGRILATRREVAAAELELKTALGLDPQMPVRVIADSTPRAPLPASVDSLVRLAMLHRPDVAAAHAAARQGQALVALARREALPNMRVGGVAERDTQGGERRIGVAVGIGLPLLNRNRGLIGRRQAEAAQLELQARAVDLGVRTDVLNAVRAYEAATAEVAVYEASVLEPARQTVALLEAAYRAGKYSLPTLLLLRNQLLDAELSYWAAWFAAREAAVRLDIATAALPVTSAARGSAPARNRP